MTVTSSAGVGPTRVVVTAGSNQLLYLLGDRTVARDGRPSDPAPSTVFHRLVEEPVEG